MSRPAFLSSVRRRRAAVLLPVLTLLTALFAAGIPTLIERSQTSSLQQALKATTPAERAMIGTAQALPFEDANSVLQPSLLDEATSEYATQVPAGAGAEPSLAWSGARLSSALPLLAKGTDATIDLEYRSSTSAHLRLLSGTMPTTATDPDSTAATTEFDIALSAPTAKLYGVSAGGVITLRHYRLRVTGIYAPTDPSSEFWYYDPGLETPTYIQNHAEGYWVTDALVGPGELPTLNTATVDGNELDPVDIMFCVPLNTAGYRPQDVGSLLTSLTAFNTGLVTAELHMQSTAGPIAELTSFQQQRQSIDAILALVMSAVAIIGAVTMLLSTQLAIVARRRYHVLLKARGQSRVQLFRRTCVKLGLPNLVAAVLAGAAALAVSPSDWTPLSSILLGAVAVVGLFGPPLLAVVDLWSRSSGSTERHDLVRRPRTPRRRVFELVILLLAAAAVVELRREGLGGIQQGTNTLGTLVPVLVAALATIIAARCYPLLLRPAERVAGRRGGPVSFLGLAGASRSALPLTAPAFVITLTLTLAALGGLMERAVDSGRVAHTWQSIGADGVVTPAGDTTWSQATKADTALANVPGVTHVTMVASQVDYTTNSDIFVVDPGSYSAVAADTPWPFGSALPDHAVPGPVPVLAEPGPGRALGTVLEVSPAYAERFQAKIVGYVSQTPAAPTPPGSGLSAMLVPAWAVAADTADWPASQILVSGTAIDESAMNTVLNKSLPGSTTIYRAELLDQYTHAPLAGLAQLGYLVGLLVAAAFGVCAILLSLSLSGPARTRRLTLLSTLGLTPRQARGIALTETVPLIAATVLAGLLAAASMPAVFGDSLDLSAFTGLSGPSSFGFDPGIPLLAALTAAVLTALAVAAQAAVAHRRNAGAELRMGEDADA